MKICHARVSGTTGLGTKIEKLKDAGCQCIYRESLSGKNAKRPVLQRMLKALRVGDCVYLVRLNRLWRIMKDMFSTTVEINEAGAGLTSLDCAIDSSDNSLSKEWCGAL